MSLASSVVRSLVRSVARTVARNVAKKIARNVARMLPGVLRGTLRMIRMGGMLRACWEALERLQLLWRRFSLQTQAHLVRQHCFA